ncbi:hypothetical protein AVEN_197737-1 [Araneus ventricosus]|uniref:Uncharacterized protein n=1 Tax=Araneus ventricosus TaxID=182803 RepID=A0A4Y2CLF0_ARAVE|nr:hypothetical protein AVEN_197737-1 [Araneus ventricosus]
MNATRNANPFVSSHSDPYCTYSPRLHQFHYFRVREPPPTYLYRSHLCIYGQALQMERLDFQPSWISKLRSTPFPFSLEFRTDGRFLHGAVEFAWTGLLVNVQP